MELTSTVLGRREKAARALLAAIAENRAEPKQLAAALRICNNPRGLPKVLVDSLRAAAEPAIDAILLADETGTDGRRLEADESASLVRALAQDEQSQDPVELTGIEQWPQTEIDATIHALMRIQHRGDVEIEVNDPTATSALACWGGKMRDAIALGVMLLPDREALLDSLLGGIFSNARI